MHVRRSVSRVSAALILSALLVVPMAGDVAAAQRGSGTAASPLSQAPSAKLAKLHSQLKLTNRRSTSRGSVNVRTLSKQAPKIRPTKQLPFLTRKPATGAAGGGTRSPKVGVLAPTLPTLATTNADAPAALPSFDGLSDQVADLEPPDPWVAVGPEHVVQAVNTTMRTTNRAGGSPVDVALADFFNLPTNPVTFSADPHVIYDSLHGRWIATEVSWDCDTSGGSDFGTGYIDYAISSTTDPNGTWHVDFIVFPDALPDYPAPGTSTDKIAIASNVYNMTTAGNCVSGLTSDGTAVDVLDWADAVTGTSDAVDEITTPPFIFGFRVAAQVPATSPKLQLVVLFDAGTPGQLNTQYVTLIGSVVAGTLDFESAFDLNVDNVMSPAVDPPQPNQAGPDTIDTAVDIRITDAIWQSNRLVLVATYPCGTGPRDCVRVTELNTTGTSTTVRPSLTQDFLINETGKDLFMGGIGLAGNGTLHVGWTRSSLTDSPSSFAAHQAKGDALGSISAAELLAAGTAAYGGERWGDYVGIAQDPQVPNQVWNANQYSGGTEWRTKVTPLQTAGSTYVPMAPVRILDTRIGTGLSGRFIANSARTWMVAGVSGIAANAVAITANVTVVGQQSAGSVSVTVTPTGSPPSSTINFPLGETRANNLVVPLSSSGSVSAVFKGTSGKGTHLVFDVTGYFLADTSGATFNPITPIRAIDTRIGTGFTGKFVANTPRTLVVAGTLGVPVSATAVTGNVVIVQPSKLGSGAVTKDPTATPSTSTLNFPAHTNRANGVFAPLDGAGALSIVYNAAAGGTADVVLDLTGYFLPDLTGLKFVPLNPSRIVDTRPPAVLSGLHGKLATGVTKTLQVNGHWGVPAAAVAVTGNMTVTGSTANGSVSATPDPNPAPTTSTINFVTGAVIANGFVGPLNGSGQMSFIYLANSAGKTTDLVIDLSGYFQ
jgi:hypothetical protein